MRLFIASDFHINESKRFEDTEHIMYLMLRDIQANRPDVLVILGDIFDKRKPTPKEIRCLDKWLLQARDLVERKIILLEGNHDQDLGISSLSYLKDLHIDKVQVVSPPFKFGKFYFGHEQIDGAEADNGIKLSGGQTVNSLIKDNPDTEVFAFGHFHKPQVLHEHPLVFYAGSINNKTFGERDDKKRAWFFDDDGFRVFFLPTRKMYQFDLDVKENEAGIVPWPSKDVEGSLVKIVFSGTATALRGLNKDAIMKLKEEKKLYSLTVEYRVIDKTKPRNEKVTESIDEETALREYFNDKKLSISKKEVVEAGIKLISEVNNA